MMSGHSLSSSSWKSSGSWHQTAILLMKRSRSGSDMACHVCQGTVGSSSRVGILSGSSMMYGMSVPLFEVAVLDCDCDHFACAQQCDERVVCRFIDLGGGVGDAGEGAPRCCNCDRVLPLVGVEYLVELLRKLAVQFANIKACDGELLHQGLSAFFADEFPVEPLIAERFDRWRVDVSHHSGCECG